MALVGCESPTVTAVPAALTGGRAGQLPRPRLDERAGSWPAESGCRLVRHIRRPGRAAKRSAGLLWRLGERWQVCKRVRCAIDTSIETIRLLWRLGQMVLIGFYSVLQSMGCFAALARALSKLFQEHEEWGSRTTKCGTIVIRESFPPSLPETPIRKVDRTLNNL